MADAPLSALIAEHATGRSADSYPRFLALFRSSTLGIVAVGGVRPDGRGGYVADGNMGASQTTYGDGCRRILAFADPEVALRNFGQRFNAGVPGETLLRMVAADPGCHGILVNSALTETSIIITRETAQRLL